MVNTTQEKKTEVVMSIVRPLQLVSEYIVELVHLNDLLMTKYLYVI